MNNRIRELREQHGWTQQELADLVLVSRQTIISLEGGRYNPSILLAYKIAKAFDSVIEKVFLFGEDENG